MQTTRARQWTVILLVTVLGTGCASKVRRTETDQAFPHDFARVGRVALGGVVPATTLDAVFAPDDAQDADDALYRAFLAARPDLVIWSAPATSERAGADTLGTVATEYARYGRLRADQLAPLRVPLAENRFLVLARLTSDAISSHSVNQDQADPEARAEGLPEHSSAWPSTVTTERTVEVSLDVFDLATGGHAWHGEVRTRDRERYEYRDELEQDGAAYLQERLAAADAPHLLARRGDYLKAPDLVDLIEQALTELVGRLPGGGS